MNDDQRGAYVAEFLRVARPAVTHDLADWSGVLETLDVEHAETGEAHATALVGFRGRRYRYRQRIWPATHPPALRAGLYATTLTERLLTGPADAPTGNEIIPI